MPRRSLSTLINISRYLNKDNCFPERIEIDDATSTQLEKKIHKDWMNDFAQFLYDETRDSKLFESAEEIREKMQGHVRKRSNPAQNYIAQGTEKLFKLIWCVIKFTQDKTILPGFNYKAEQATSVAIELVDGLKNCSNGVYERCANHWKRISSAQTIDNELHSMLVELVTNIAHRHFEEDEVGQAMEVHEKDLYFINAKELGIPLEASGAHYRDNPQDPYISLEFVKSSMSTTRRCKLMRIWKIECVPPLKIITMRDLSLSKVGVTSSPNIRVGSKYSVN